LQKSFKCGVRNAERGMRNCLALISLDTVEFVALSPIPHSAFRVPHSGHSAFRTPHFTSRGRARSCQLLNDRTGKLIRFSVTAEILRKRFSFGKDVEHRFLDPQRRVGLA
jgi:hypothetical protein